jgi:signal transduction histidine kinase
VLLSLVSNAAEAIEPPDGEISVETETLELGRAALDRLLFGQEREPGRYLRLTVRDNGSGIEAKTLERIFVPFFSTRFAGRGLGLAAVQGIVRGHKGALRVESTPGQGTIFSVYLPSLSTWHERAP